MSLTRILQFQSDHSDLCGAVLTISDDWGDNDRTIFCQGSPSHEGDHHCVLSGRGVIQITWDMDERPIFAWDAYQDEIRGPDNWEEDPESMPPDWDWREFLSRKGAGQP